MKIVKYFAAGLTLLLILIPATGSAQEDTEKEERKPEIKWDVQKHFDENGNLLRFDSTYSWSWSNHDFTSTDLDSLFEKIFGDFKFCDSVFGGPLPSMPHSFLFPEDFPDSLFNILFGSSPFPDAFMTPPDFEGFNDFFSFPDQDDWFEHQQEGQKKSGREVEI